MKRSERLRAEADALQSRADALAFTNPAESRRILRQVRRIRIKQKAAEYYEQAIRAPVTKTPD